MGGFVLKCIVFDILRKDLPYKIRHEVTIRAVTVEDCKQSRIIKEKVFGANISILVYFWLIIVNAWPTCC